MGSPGVVIGRIGVCNVTERKEGTKLKGEKTVTRDPGGEFV